MSSLDDVLSRRLLEQASALVERFRTGDPFPHLVIDDFFDAAFCERLVREFPPFDRGNSINELGTRGGKSTIQDLRGLGGAYARADDTFRSAEFGRLIAAITGIDGLIYDPEYIGGGTHENLAGQELDPHVDFNYHPTTGWHRRLNLIVYLNPEWEEEWGGALEFHLDPWLPPSQNRIKTVSPISNRAVIFATSERSWHGFQAIKPPPHRPNLSRQSLALYMYTRDRPSEETAPPHQTIYVPRPLPTVLSPDKAVTAKDRERIAGALVRRAHFLGFLAKRDAEQSAPLREQVEVLLRKASVGIEADEIALIERVTRHEDELIKYFYDREKQHAADLAALRAAVARPRVPRLPLRDPTVTVIELEGLWPDLWAGPRFRCSLQPLMPVTTLVLRGHIPPALAGGQRLSCALNGHRAEQRFGPGAFTWELPFPASIPAELELAASEVFRPSAAGQPDDRELSYMLLEVSLS
jgi:hypothetical protein